MKQHGIEDLALADANTFKPHVNQAFTLNLADKDVPLFLDEVRTLPDHSRGTLKRAPFSLLFSGPRELLLPQRTYRIEHESLGALELFLVPVAPALYEAVFT